MTDEQLNKAFWSGREKVRSPHMAERDLAGYRAIEAAATAPLLERIAELEAKIAQQAEAQEPCQSMCETPCTKRKPLTIAEVEAILARWSYELHGDRARFIVRETELAHGIGAAAAMAPEEAE